MRRLLLTTLSIVLTAGAGLVGVATAPAATAAQKPTTKVVTAPVEIWQGSAAQTPGGKPDYCAVVVFVLFEDVPGFEPTTIDHTTIYGSDSYGIESPYDDAFTWGPLSRPAPAGMHQSMVSGQPAVWSAGSADCSAAYERTVAVHSPTAEVTYEAVGTCLTAIEAFNKADRDVKRAKRRVANASTPTKLADARAQLAIAKKKLAKARKRYARNC